MYPAGCNRVTSGQERSMRHGLLVVGCVMTLSVMTAVTGQTAGPRQQTPTSTASSLSPERALLNQYCITCHNQRAKAAGQEAARKIALDQLDVDGVSENREAWEKVVRKLRAGMMPPAGARRPDETTYRRFITSLENELDRAAVPSPLSPGLHRLNRTEYADGT